MKLTALQATGVATGLLGLLWFLRSSKGSRKNTDSSRREKLGVRVVCISDTHGRHRTLDVPDGDVLVHGGDYTHFGKETDAVDFNEWLGSLPHKVKIVVEGNHEAHAPWARKADSILSNATYLKGSTTQCHLPGKPPLKISGSAFYWPLSAVSPHNPYVYPPDVHIIVTHGPPKGKNDSGTGCPLSLQAIEAADPYLVVSGHIHSHAGVTTDAGITYVNAAMCEGGYTIKREPIVIDL